MEAKTIYMREAQSKQALREAHPFIAKRSLSYDMDRLPWRSEAT